MIIDVTRALDRALQGHLPTGIDRVSLEYLGHFGASSNAMVRWGGRWLVLSPVDSQRLFDALLSVDSATLWRMLWSLGNHYVLNWRSPSAGSILFNIGHSGLQNPSYAIKVRRYRLRPIYFLHDLIPISHPEYSRAGEAQHHHLRLETILETAYGVVVNSVFTGEEFLAYAKDSGRTMPPWVVAPLAPGRLSTPKPKRPIPEPYFVILGTIEARKNHLLLLQVWRQFLSRGPTNTLKLVVIGRRGWECEQVIDLLDRCDSLRGMVIELSRCGDDDLATWLGHAQALLFPSFVEGYGIPLVEALMLGVPVIASDLPVFHEIAGDIPHYLDPTDGPGWRQTILDYADSSSAARQAQLERLAEYSPPTWEQHFAVVDALVREIDAGN